MLWPQVIGSQLHWSNFTSCLYQRLLQIADYLVTSLFSILKASTPGNVCPIPTTTNDTDLDMSADSLTDTQDQDISNTAILTYDTEDQTGQKSAPIHVSSKPVQPRQEVRKSAGSLLNPLRSRPLTTPGLANWLWRSPSHIIYYHLGRQQGTTHHYNYPSSYRARFNSIKRNTSSMLSRTYHLCPEPREV